MSSRPTRRPVSRPAGAATPRVGFFAVDPKRSWVLRAAVAQHFEPRGQRLGYRLKLRAPDLVHRLAAGTRPGRPPNARRSAVLDDASLSRPAGRPSARPQGELGQRGQQEQPEVQHQQDEHGQPPSAQRLEPRAERGGGGQNDGREHREA